MSVYSLYEAKNKLSALVDAVERGDEITITRRGRPVARLSGVGPGHDVAKARKAAAGLRALGQGQSLGGLSIRDLIDEGRR